ncbi:MAG: T9SS type A sorting domain-containing protein [bacterium]|nr:T9SS type A sorting domain-containing protein [bacterium]
MDLTLLQKNLTGDNASFAEDVKVIDGIAYVADGTTGIKAYNVTDISNTYYVDGIDPFGSSYNTCITGIELRDILTWGNTTRLFIGSENEGLSEIDATDPSNLVEVGKYNQATEDIKFVRDIFIHDNGEASSDKYLYLASDAGLILYSCPSYVEAGVKSLQNKRLVSAIGRLNGVYATADYAFGARSDGYLTIINVQDKSNPFIVSNLQLPNAQVLWDVYVQGDVAYLMDQGSHFYIVDVSNKSNPKLLNAYTFADEPTKSGSEGRIVVIGDYAIMGNQYPSDGRILRAFDISSSTEIIETGYYQLSDGSGIIGIDIINNVVYSANTKNGLQIYEFNPDGFKFNITATKSVDYEVEDQIDVYVSRYYSGVPFTYASVYLEDYYGNRISEPFNPDEFGNVSFNITKTDTLPTRVVAVNTSVTTQIEKRDVFANYKKFASVTINKNELPAIKDENALVSAYEYSIYPPNEELNTPRVPSVGAVVTTTFTDKDGNILGGATDIDGLLEINGIYQRGTGDVRVTVDKVGCLAYTLTVKPYMWSNSAEAFGTNNQEKIMRKENSDSMFMVYTTGDSVVYGVSPDFGATWSSLTVLGKGNNPSIVRTPTGKLVVWKESYNTLAYAIQHSPWTPIDTVNPTDLWPTEPVLGYNYTTNKTYMGYIGNRYINVDRGDFVLGSMTGLDENTMLFDTVVSYYGDRDYVPMKSPVFSLYSQSTGIVSYLIGFIDTSDNYVGKLFNRDYPQWEPISGISNANQTCNAPTTDYYGDATSFVYEAVNTDETKDIYRRKLNKGIIDANAVKVNVTTGKNEYPKASNGIFVNYINNSNKLITNYSGNDISVYTGADSIHTTEFETKPLLMTKVRGYHIWSEGSNGNYRIKWMTRDYYPGIFTFIESEPEDTVEKVTTSPLYEYIAVKEPVEQLNTTINGLNPEMNYTIKVITSEGSPVKPQIIQIDKEVYAVVTGHANRPDTTEITLPKETYQDYSVVVSIDRKRGNPNRDAEVLVYQYETDGEEVVAVSNKIQTFAPVNTTETSTNLFTSKDNAYINYTSERAGEVEIEVYNVTGSKVTSMKANVKEGTNNIGLKNLNKSGIFFVKINSDGITETKRINIIK